MNIFDRTMQTVESSLNYASAKNQAIANNIANVDTPNYRSKDVVFKNVLQQTIKARKTNPAHLPFGSEHHADYRVVHKQGTIYNHNGNNVDIDKEMANLAKNQLYYQSLVDRLNGKFNDLQTVIRGGS
ncbi:MAG TPA: flagellar basal body rod protein FlgB [Virgibacillus sp.]|nr:flagellar basal body rod protein FlgB [Virgibacillus sp.]